MPGLHWTAKAIQAKSDALDACGAERITLAAETIALMVAALRFLARDSLAEHQAVYTVQAWDDTGNHIVEHIGTLGNYAAARAAFAAASEARPESEVTMRQGILVVERRSAAPWARWPRIHDRFR